MTVVSTSATGPRPQVGQDTDQVLIMTDRVYYPNIGTATGEWTEDGFVWHPDNPKVLEPEWCNNYKPIRVTHWAAISLPIQHYGGVLPREVKESE